MSAFLACWFVCTSTASARIAWYLVTIWWYVLSVRSFFVRAICFVEWCEGTFGVQRGFKSGGEEFFGCWSVK